MVPAKRRRVNTISVIKYYFHLFLAYGSYWLSYGYDMFREYPGEIQIAIGVTLMSFVMILIMSFSLLVMSFAEKSKNKLEKRLIDRFGEGMDYIFSPAAPANMTYEDIAGRFDIDPAQIGKDLLKNRREKLAFIDIFYMRFITQKSHTLHKENIRTVLHIFGVPEFLEKEVSLKSMKNKVNAMSMMRTFKLPISLWVLNSLLNSKYLRVRRLAMYSNIMLSSDNDLDYFETDFFDKHCCIKDEIELAYSLQRRRKAGLKLPNLARWANLQKGEKAQCLFVRLMRRFDEVEYCGQLRPLMSQTRKKKLIEEISRTWGYLHYTDGEDLLREILLTQPDDSKVAIMHALTRFATGKALPSLLEGYHNTKNPHVRFEALRCIYNYGEEGKKLFRELEENASEADRKFFGFFNNPITLEKIRLDKEQAYHPSVETVYNESSF